MARAKSSPELSPEQRLAEAYRNTFTSESGKAVLDDLRKSYGRRKSFVPGQADTTAYHEGQRDVYLRIMAFLDPDMFDEEETQ